MGFNMQKEPVCKCDLLATTDSVIRQNQVHDAFLSTTIDVSPLLVKLHSDVDEVGQSIDSCSFPPIICKHEGMHDPIKTFKPFRDTHAASLDVYHSLLSAVESLQAASAHFRLAIRNFEREIDCSTRHCGLDRLPDELLLEILMIAREPPQFKRVNPWDVSASYHYTETSLKSTLSLSHVCKRFRSVMTSSRKIWNEYYLHTYWPMDKIETVSKWSGYKPLKAKIVLYNRDRLDEPAKTILNLRPHLEKLGIIGVTLETLEGIQKYLKGSGLPALKFLDIAYTGDSDFNSSLHQTEFCQMPYLQGLSVNFVPHPSLSSSLVRCDLRLYKNFHLREILDFLRPASRLEDLRFNFAWDFVDQQNAHTFDPICLPNLTVISIEARRTASIVTSRVFMEKIVPYSARKLVLRLCDEHYDLHALVPVVEGRLSIRELDLGVWSGNSFRAGGMSFGSLADRVEILTLRGAMVKSAAKWIRQSGPSNMIRLRLIRIEGQHKLNKSSIISLRDIFLDEGYSAIQIEFKDCEGAKDGVFSLGDVDSAFIDDEDPNRRAGDGISASFWSITG